MNQDKAEVQTLSSTDDGVLVRRELATSKYFDKPVPKPKLTLIGHGGCGANTTRDLMYALPPALYESCDFRVLESNGNVLEDHFSEKAVRASNNENFRNWFESGRINIEMLGQGIGAGGNPEEGKSLLSKILERLKPAFTPWHNVIQYGGGGGGTASGTMPLMAETLKGWGIPTYSIITLPRAKELSVKIARAQQALQELLAISPTQVIYNENNPNKDLDVEVIHSAINKQGLYPSIYLLRALIQEVGNVSDHDIADWRSDVQKGNHALSGLYENVAEDFAGIEKGLLQNPYLNNNLIKTAEALEIWLEAGSSNGWTELEIDHVHDIFQSKFKNKTPEAPVDVKVGIKKHSGYAKKTVGFVSFSPTVSRGQQEQAKVQIAVAGLPEPFFTEASDSISDRPNGEAPIKVVADPTGNGNGHAKLVAIRANLEGSETQVTVEIPEELAVAYQNLFVGNMTNDRNIIAIQTQNKIEQLTGKQLHVPVHGSSARA